ncbi:MAG: hypothetical protein U9N80_12465, partial [Chloroflexota bacterium]|nr:hypothetical protein [Chloroflexota bacterium]
RAEGEAISSLLDGRLRSFGFAPETPLRFASGALSETGDFAQDRRRPYGLLAMTTHGEYLKRRPRGLVVTDF